MEAGWKRSHNTRGEAADSADKKVDKYDEGRLIGETIYGRREARAQIGLKLGTHHLRYTNNDQHYRDRNVNNGSGTFYYNLGPKTQLLAEIEHTRYLYQTDYLSEDYSLDASEWRYMLGATWRATWKTTGKFKIGWYDYDVDTDELGDTNGPTYALGMIWKPKSYSTVDINWSRRTQQTIVDDTSAYVANIYEFEWVHNFNNRTALKLGFEYEKDDYKGGLEREDKLYDFDIALIYRLSPRYDLEGSYGRYKRDSDAEDNDYKANVFMLTLSTRFK
jgi:hypothetical protein